MFMSTRKLEIILEFFVFGVILGVTEDIIAVKVATGETLTWEVIGIIVLVAIPFAIIGELVVDNLNLTRGIEKIKGKETQTQKRVDRNKK